MTQKVRCPDAGATHGQRFWRDEAEIMTQKVRYPDAGAILWVALLVR
jgi:hypothetical protein